MSHHELLVFLLLLQIQLVGVCSLILPSGSGGTHGNHTAIPAVPCLPDQASALLRLKRSFSVTDETTCTLGSWRASTDCCRWEGVRCGDANGRVNSLDLGECYLESAALDPAIFTLSSLTRLNLAYNDFNGSRFPATGFERLTELTHLNLSSTNFDGQIPIGIAHLTNLASLDLSIGFRIFEQDGEHVTYETDADFSLELANPNFQTLVANLSNLRELRLSLMHLPDGEGWCNALTNSTPMLEVLSLPFCSLSGPICGSLSSLQYLSLIDLQHNSLSGPVPEFFANFSFLNVLQLSTNRLEGWFSPRILQNLKLTSVDITYNIGIYGNMLNFSADSSLANLLLSSTNFSGVVPKSIRNLKSLENLGLTASGLSEEALPSSIGNLRYLKRLYISGFGLVGSIPSWVTNLTSLTVLQFSNCGLSGSLPSSIGNLKNLRKLALYKCNFSGNIPSHISNLTQLRRLYLQSNNFVGTVELTSFWKLPDLSILNLSYNKLSVVDGEDNSSSVSSPELCSLHLASCNISKFLNSIRHQDNIRHLDLSNNQLHGAIPRWVWKTWNVMIIFNLSHNKFTSVGHDAYLPLEISYLDLSFNMFEGPIPVPQGEALILDYSNNRFSSIPPNLAAHLRDAVFLKASRNNLSGEIPPSICNVSLEVLDLSYNNLSGSIPSCLMEDAISLQMLSLKENQLRGKLPHNIKKGCAFQALDFSGNLIEGQLPRSLSACTNLEVLDIGNNEISDSFPCWMSLLPKLQVLVLKSNNFFGHVGPALVEDENSCIFAELRILGLASNSFSGTLPEEWFKKLNSMMVKSTNGASVMEDQFLRGRTYQFTAAMTYKGHDITLSSILRALVFIDVSDNAFHGSIPKAIGELVMLNALNMSHNALTGSIPSQLGGLHQLESLDLSSNDLSGEIPDDLVSLNFLATLNLSYNKLVGRIPGTSQFSTFSNSSFIGNTGLCGPPLSKQCSNVTTPTSASHPPKKNSADIMLFLFTGLGFGVGFAIVIVVIWGLPTRNKS